MNNKAINCKTRIGSLIIKVYIKRLFILEAQVLNNNGISGLIINIKMLILKMSM
jgi:hypothetical protein